MTIRIENKLARGKKGFSLVEVLIALLLLTIVGLGYMTVLANSSNHTLNADTRATAESVARSQMESIKSSAYQTDATQYTPIAMPSTSWQVSITGTLIGNGLQKVNVAVVFQGKPVLNLEGYKSS